MAPFALNAASSVANPPSNQRVVGLPQPLPRGTTTEVLEILCNQSLAALVRGALRDAEQTILYVHDSRGGAPAALDEIGRVIPLRREPGVAVAEQLKVAFTASAGIEPTELAAVVGAIRVIIVDLPRGDSETVIAAIAGEMGAEGSLISSETLLIALHASDQSITSLQKALSPLPHTAIFRCCYNAAVALVPFQETVSEVSGRQRSARSSTGTTPSSSTGNQLVLVASLKPITIGDASSAEVDLSLLLARARNEGSEAARELSTGLHLSLQLQAEKIQQLLSDLEWVGRTVIEQEAEIRHLRQQNEGLQQSVHDAHQELAILRPWRDMGHARLGPTFELANHQIDVFRSYVAALESPGHRAIGYLGRRLGRGRFGGSLRKVMNLAIALRKA